MQLPNLLRDLARVTIVVTFACALGLALAFHLGSETTWWIELTRYAPYPLYLLPALLALLLSALLGWRWRLAALLTLLLVVVGLMDLRIGRADEGSQRMRLMTYNVKSFRAVNEGGGLARIAWEIASHDPDVVMMQDADYVDPDDKDGPEALRVALDKRQHYRFGQYVIASRWPLRDCGVGEMPFQGQRHTYVSCTMAAPGQDIRLVNLHFKSPRDGLNATRHERLAGLAEWRQNFADRMGQARKVAEDLRAAQATRNLPLIIAGDLNAPQHSPVVRALLALGLRDAFGSAGMGWGFTHGHSLRPHIDLLRIDHILVSDELGVQDAFVGGAEASEHRPVVADLLLKR